MKGAGDQVVWGFLPLPNSATPLKKQKEPALRHDKNVLDRIVPEYLYASYGRRTRGSGVLSRVQVYI